MIFEIPPKEIQVWAFSRNCAWFLHRAGRRSWRHDSGYGAQDGFLKGAEGLGAGECGTAGEADGAGGWGYNLFSTDNRVRTWRFFHLRLI